MHSVNSQKYPLSQGSNLVEKNQKKQQCRKEDSCNDGDSIASYGENLGNNNHIRNNFTFDTRTLHTDQSYEKITNSEIAKCIQGKHKYNNIYFKESESISQISLNSENLPTESNDIGLVNIFVPQKRENYFN